MKPDIQHLGHACIQYKYKGVTLTTDPWFYPAFLGAWFPYPDNRGNLETALDSDYIYISHAHEDHFDRKFLAQVDKYRTKLIIPRFRSHYLERELAKLGFEGVFAPEVLSHGQTTRISTHIKLTMLIDRSHKEDSALLVDVPGFRFLDSNDCELAISDWPTDVDLLASQFSGATWYPQCYSYDRETMLSKTVEVNVSNMERLFRRVQLTGAKAYLPSAGPACFLPPELMHFSKGYHIFPTWKDTGYKFSTKLAGVGIWDYLSNDTDLKMYQLDRRSEWSAWYHEPDNTVTVEELNAHFLQLQRNNKRWMNGYREGIYLTSGNRSWEVRLGTVERFLEEAPEPSYFMDIPMRVLRAVIDGRASWETALISHRIKLRREPDYYDLKLMGLLNFGDRPIQTVTMAKQQDPSEMTIKNGFEFQRWCPHAGEDLNFATVEGGKIKCPRHGWCWDTATGECLTGQGVPLKIRSSDDDTAV